MRTKYIAVAALATGLLSARALSAQQLPTVVLKHGMTITRSVRIAPRVYRLRAPAGDTPVVTIRGSNIIVDFAGATLLGSAPGTAPDEAHGLAILVDGGQSVRVRNVRVHGYRVGLRARGTRALTIADGDFSDNWKPRLFSGIEHESLVDWLSHHHNEAGEWLRFGAGIYLEDVHGGEIRGNRIEHGMEGLMIVRSDSLRVWNNIIQFNSGVGIALYRASDNVIMHNFASFNVRGFSAGFYRRGQDSADLLMYEQSSRNVVAYNSMTHGGDGLFLWAGQQTMDTGLGGSNDNLFYANDFSYAPTNAMEATFSRNDFVANRAQGSEHGLWGGYSYESAVRDNEFGGNRIGIAIEHGQDNRITGNRFAGDSTAISLWAIPEQPSDWGYPKHRDTHSRDYTITGNHFDRNRVALRVANTQRAQFGDNTFNAVDSMLVVRDTMTRVLPGSGRSDQPRYTPPRRLPGGLDPARDPLARMNREAIIVDEWGPYDWRAPRLWPAGRSDVTPLRLRVLGPVRTWQVAARRGISKLSRTHGTSNDTIVVTPASDAAGDWRLTLRDERGRNFSYERFQPIATWSVDFFKHDSLLTHRDTARLDYMSYGAPIKGIPADSFRIVAAATVDLAPGNYTLRSISDDAVRVWVDDKLVIDDWTPHESIVDTAPIAPGRHALRVEYLQVGGWMELRVEIVRGVQKSAGSPPPH